MSNVPRCASNALLATILCFAVFISQFGKLAGVLYPAEGLSYQTSLAVGGLPVIDIRFPPRRVDDDMTGQLQLDACLACGVIAVGPYAVGFVAVGGLSVGILSVGLVSLAAWTALGVVGIAASRACGVLAVAPKRRDVARMRADEKIIEED